MVQEVERLVSNLDRSRKYILLLVTVVMLLLAYGGLLTWAYLDLSHYIKQPEGRENRLEFQCAMEEIHDLPKEDC